jgi:hypothetical protein
MIAGFFKGSFDRLIAIDIVIYDLPFLSHRAASCLERLFLVDPVINLVRWYEIYPKWLAIPLGRPDAAVKRRSDSNGCRDASERNKCMSADKVDVKIDHQILVYLAVCGSGQGSEMRL